MSLKDSFLFYYLSAINKGRGEISDTKALLPGRRDCVDAQRAREPRKSISNRLYRWQINEVEGNNAPSYETSPSFISARSLTVAEIKIYTRRLPRHPARCVFNHTKFSHTKLPSLFCRGRTTSKEFDEIVSHVVGIERVRKSVVCHW